MSFHLVKPAKVRQLLLGLDDGDSMVIEGVRWTSYGEHGFHVTNLGLAQNEPDSVDRNELKRVFNGNELLKVEL